MSRKKRKGEIRTPFNVQPHDMTWAEVRRWVPKVLDTLESEARMIVDEVEDLRLEGWNPNDADDVADFAQYVEETFQRAHDAVQTAAKLSNMMSQLETLERRRAQEKRRGAR